MQFKAASAVPRTVVATGVSAFAIVAMAFAGVAPKIFHHWPHAIGPMMIVDADSSPDIFHHWPHVKSMAAAGDSDASPDIFHHWPHAI